VIKKEIEGFLVWRSDSERCMDVSSGMMRMKDEREEPL
jgi:hypothetical protein